MRNPAVVSLAALTFGCVAAQPLRAAPAGEGVQAAAGAAAIYAEASAVASRLAADHTPNARLLRFAAGEVAADERSLRHLQPGLPSVVASREPAADEVRTGRSVSTDGAGAATAVPEPALSAEVPAIALELRQLADARDGAFDARYRRFEAELLVRSAQAFAALAAAAPDASGRAAASAEQARLGAALAELKRI